LALDPLAAAGILDLVMQMQRTTATACLFITHDLGMVSGIADQVVVMHRGRIVEQGAREAVLNYPREPYGNSCSRRCQAWSRAGWTHAWLSTTPRHQGCVHRRLDPLMMSEITSTGLTSRLPLPLISPREECWNRHVLLKQTPFPA